MGWVDPAIMSPGLAEDAFQEVIGELVHAESRHCLHLIHVEAERCAQLLCCLHGLLPNEPSAGNNCHFSPCMVFCRCRQVPCSPRLLHVAALSLLYYFPVPDPPLCPKLCRQAPKMRQMSVQELSALLNDPAAREDTQFIDVREPEEHRLAALPLFELQPLSRWAPAEHPCQAEGS